MRLCKTPFQLIIYAYVPGLTLPGVHLRPGCSEAATTATLQELARYLSPTNFYDQLLISGSSMQELTRSVGKKRFPSKHCAPASFQDGGAGESKHKLASLRASVINDVINEAFCGF